MKLVETWDEWCVVYNRLDFWRDEISLVCEAHDVECRLIEPTFPGTHAVFFVNKDIVLKMYCPIRHNSCEKEMELHTGPLEGNRLFPQVRFHGRSPSGYDYIGFTRLHGMPVREKPLTEIGARDLAYAVADLHNKTPDSATGLRCLVHYDLTEDHVYLDDQGRLDGIIDFGDARMAHPSDELPVLFVSCLRCDDSLIAAFREAYDSTAGYQISDEDLADALHRHDYCQDMIGSLQRASTRFAMTLLDRYSAMSQEK